MLENESFVGLTQTEASLIAEESQPEVLSRIDGMLEAAQGDWPTYLKVSGTVDLGWVDAFDRHYTHARSEKTIDQSDPADFANDYIVICCECGAVLGQVLRSLHPRLVWRLDWPYWDSCLLDPKAGCTIAVFALGDQEDERLRCRRRARCQGSVVLATTRVKIAADTIFCFERARHFLAVCNGCLGHLPHRILRNARSTWRFQSYEPTEQALESEMVQSSREPVTPRLISNRTSSISTKPL